MKGTLKACSTLAATLALTCSIEAMAMPFVLDFEGVGDNAIIGDFYNGGTDSQGNSGTNYGVGFGPNALGLIDADAGGNGNFANEPTPDTAMFFLNASSAVLDFAPGFDVGFSFFYSTAQNASVSVWDGLGATGTLLGTIELFQNSNANGCVGDPNGTFCNFDIGELAFAGIARSIDFSGTANQVGFDNITFGSTNPVDGGNPTNPPTSVAEPGVLSLLGLNLLALGLARTKKRKNMS